MNQKKREGAKGSDRDLPIQPNEAVDPSEGSGVVRRVTPPRWLPSKIQEAFPPEPVDRDPQDAVH